LEVFRESLHLPIKIHKRVFMDAKAKKKSLAAMVSEKLSEKFRVPIQDKGKHKKPIFTYPKSQRITATLCPELKAKLDRYQKSKGIKKFCEAVYLALTEAYKLPLSVLATKHTGRKINK